MTQMAHECHAIECHTPVPPSRLMCLKHWRMVPRAIQKRVWAEYRPGQEVDKQPTTEYLRIMQMAINAVAIREGKIKEGEPHGS